MNTHPIFGQMINGMMEAQRLTAPGTPSPGMELPRHGAPPAWSSPGMEPPRPMGCPNCAQAEAEVDRLKSALDLEAKARVAAAEMAQEAKLAQAQAEGDATALLFLLAQIREAVGDNGRRMQGELLDYLRILWEEADPDRVSQREAELRAQDYATPHDPSDAGAWGEDRFEAAS